MSHFFIKKWVECYWLDDIWKEKWQRSLRYVQFYEVVKRAFSKWKFLQVKIGIEMDQTYAKVSAATPNDRNCLEVFLNVILEMSA